MTRDWNTVTDTQDRRKMLGIANVTRKLSISSTVLVFNVVMVFTVSRCVAIRQTGRELYLRAYFPYNATRTPCYELTFLGQFMGTAYAATTYTSVDTFIATLVLHTCGQLSNLRRELTNLCAYTKAEFQTKLSNIARKHEHLNRFAERIEDSFNKMLLIQMLGCSLQLCFQFLQAFTSMMDTMDEVFIFKIAFLAIYVVYVLLQLYLYCYIGEKLLIESTKIAYAAYECSWYNLSAREARSLVIIMCRARSPLQISAGRFCSFNRELYSEVLNLNLSNLLLLLVLKAIVFGAGYIGQQGYKGRELEDENIVSESELTLALGYLIGDTCLYRAACEEPHIAKDYLGAAEMLLQTMKLMPQSLPAEPRYEKMITEFRKAIEYGSIEQCPPEYSCKKENINNFLRSENR